MPSYLFLLLLLLLLQYAIMLLVAVNTLLRYVLHTIDLRSEDPWENKTIYMRYVDIGIGKHGEGHYMYKMYIHVYLSC